MNRLDTNDEDALIQQTAIPQPWQTSLTTILLLVTAYYVWPYLVYNTTIKRRIYNFCNSIVPTRSLHVLEKVAARISALPKDSPGDSVAGRTNPLTRFYEGSGTSAVVQRARSLSGFDKVAAEISFSGLGNWDNSCFQNSVLQSLASLPMFRDFVNKNWDMSEAAGLSAPTYGALKDFLGQLLQEVDGKNILWPPSTLRSMDTWQQQDAQEYFSKIMDATEKEAVKYQRTMTKRMAPALDCLSLSTFHEETPKTNPKANAGWLDNYRSACFSLQDNPLDGTISQSLRCQTCKFSEGLSLIPFNCLTLNLGLGGDCDVEDLLDAYTASELIEGVVCDECTKQAQPAPSHLEESSDGQMVSESSSRETKVLRTKEKQILFGRLPQDLVLHINRSIFDDWGNQKKNVAYVRYPSMLRIGPDWMEKSLIDKDTDVQAVYELRCIVTHQGRHDNGHYVACGKRGKHWYSFNDEVVTKLSEEQVLARGNVFMLFYEQVNRQPMLEVSIPDSTSSEDSCQTPDFQPSHAYPGLENTRTSAKAAQQSIVAFTQSYDVIRSQLPNVQRVNASAA